MLGRLEPSRYDQQIFPKRREPIASEMVSDRRRTERSATLLFKYVKLHEDLNVYILSLYFLKYSKFSLSLSFSLYTHTHTHTHIYIYIYIYELYILYYVMYVCIWTYERKSNKAD